MLFIDNLQANQRREGKGSSAPTNLPSVVGNNIFYSVSYINNFVVSLKLLNCINLIQSPG